MDSRDVGLEMRDVSIEYDLGAHRIVGAQDINLDIEPSRITALVGESGSGKSTVGTAAAGLIEEPGRITRGSIRVGGIDLANAPNQVLRNVRGRLTGVIFQDPMNCLNPSMTVVKQITEALNAHSRVPHREAAAVAHRLLSEVGIRDVDRVLASYPHELSGGMSQRVMIAMAIAPGPTMLVADEPTTALDSTIQMRILSLVRSLARERDIAILLITHDLGVAAAVADDIAVMYGTVIVEEGPARAVISEPMHPYTRHLIGAIPRGHWSHARLASLPGRPPKLDALPRECPFLQRCPSAMPKCKANPALLLRSAVDRAPRKVRCHLFDAAEER